MPTGLEFALLKTSDGDYWQFVAGGGEEGETPMQAAMREVTEEIGIAEVPLLSLDSMCMVPKCHFMAAVSWSPTLYVIPEYAFAVDIGDRSIRLSREHTEIRWIDYARACQSLKWDSNHTALWELCERLSP